jgi:hypothetical protein
MTGWLKDFKHWISTYRLINQDTVVGGAKSNTVQQDVRSVNAVKGIEKAFESQHEAMTVRSMKAHGVGCDIMKCVKDNCFVREPDRIVLSTTIKIPKRRMTRI